MLTNKQRYRKIVEDEQNRSTEGVNLSGGCKAGNYDRIALRRIPKDGCRRGKTGFPVNLSGKRTELLLFKTIGILSCCTQRILTPSILKNKRLMYGVILCNRSVCFFYGVDSFWKGEEVWKLGC